MKRLLALTALTLLTACNHNNDTYRGDRRTNVDDQRYDNDMQSEWRGNEYDNSRVDRNRTDGTRYDRTTPRY